MKLKSDNVSLNNLQPQIVLALIVASEVYNEHDVELVVTSANDSTHSGTSLHYSGSAVDLRTYSLVDRGIDPRGVRDSISSKLNVDFDVILESDHIHLEYQPRRSRT